MRLERGHAAFDYREILGGRLRAVQRDAEESWTPRQALGEILSYLDRVEFFTESDVTAYATQRRMRWLTSVLRAGEQRAQRTGLPAGQLDGVFSALIEHDRCLSAERTVTGSGAKHARDLIRLEVSFLELDTGPLSK